MRSFVCVLAVCWVLLSGSMGLKQSFNHERVVYDYIIVGGGTAGCVLANRLSEDADMTVLLLEAGPSDIPEQNPLTATPPHMIDPRLFIPIPAMFIAMQQTRIDWQFKTQPQLYAGKELVNRESLWPAGRVLGGSSSINAMKMTRGSPHDYDRWENELGNEGWAYHSVRPYFEKLEKVQDPNLLAHNSSRGQHGALPIVRSSATELADKFVRGGRSLGYNVTDPNDGDMYGFGYVQHNTDKGRRVNTAEAYLRPVMFRENLHVITDAQVTKVIIEKKKAKGVKYVKNDIVRLVYAKKEVILSAGAIMSPFILMHSGIGPKKHLTDMGIDSVVDLPVGDNLQDHLFTYLNYAINDSSLTLCPENTQNFFSVFEYLLFGTGKWSSSGTQGAAYLRSETQPAHDPSPYVELFLTTCLPGSSLQTAELWKQMTGSQDEMYDAFHALERGRPGFMILPTLLQPRSRGTVRLMDADPSSLPNITLHYLKHSQDVTDLVQAIRKTQQLIKTEAFQSVNATYVSGVHPGCTDHVFDTDEYWECFVRHKTFTDYHYSGTCRMAPSHSQAGVLDPKLRVKGISGLRVADASVMPRLVSGNTMLPVIMIAEKAADLIKQHRKDHQSNGTNGRRTARMRAAKMSKAASRHADVQT